MRHMTAKAYEWLRTGDSRVEQIATAACDPSIHTDYGYCFMLRAAMTFREQNGAGYYIDSTLHLDEWADVLPTCPECLVLLDSVLEQKQPSPTFMPRNRKLKRHVP